MERLLNEQQAVNLYQDLIEIFRKNDDVKAKFLSLRTTFDLVLSQAYDTLKKTGKLKEEKNTETGNEKNKHLGFMEKIDAIFPIDSTDQVVREMNECLQGQRITLNKELAHTANREAKKMKGKKVTDLNKELFQFYLKNTAHAIAMLSGIPIPTILIHAYEPTRIKQLEHKLDIIFLVQVYDEIQNIENGLNIIKALNEWMIKRGEYGLNDVKVRIICYSPPVSVVGDNIQQAANCVEQEQQAMEEAVKACEEAIGKWKENKQKQLKPWLVWFFHQTKADKDSTPFATVKNMLQNHQIALYPLTLKQQGIKEFEQLRMEGAKKVWQVIPGLADNLFDSISETIFRTEEKANSLNSADYE